MLVLVVAVLFLALRRWEPDTRWGLLALAVLGLALGDTLWSYLVASGTYESGSAADLPYVVEAVAVALAAWAPRVPQTARPGDDRLTLLLPGVAAMGALGLLLYGGITGDLIHARRSRWLWPRWPPAWRAGSLRSGARHRPPSLAR